MSPKAAWALPGKAQLWVPRPQINTDAAQRLKGHSDKEEVRSFFLATSISHTESFCQGSPILSVQQAGEPKLWESDSDPSSLLPCAECLGVRVRARTQTVSVCTHTPPYFPRPPPLYVQITGK